MDNISVSSKLHQKIMARTNGSPRRWPIMIKRYTASIAAIAVILLGVFTIPDLLQDKMTPVPDENPSVVRPDLSTPMPNASSTPAIDIKSKYTLYFNKADSQPADSANKLAINGHFWQELASEELKTIFPELIETHSIAATANFQSDEGKATLFYIDALSKSSTGINDYIQLAHDETVLDYAFHVEKKDSDILGKKVTAGYYESDPNSNGIRKVVCFATFKLSDIAYYVELGGGETEMVALKNEISEIVGSLIEGNVTDLDVFHPVIPELRNDNLSLAEAQADANFGQYIPNTFPKGFGFEFANRFINQENNTLLVNWTRGMDSISWRVSLLKDNDRTRITTIADTKNYDLALYPIPRAESVPEELREIVDNPIFLIDEITLDTVRARSYKVADSGDSQGHRMRFSVLYGDILVELSAKGATPEAIFKMLQDIR